VLYTKRPAAVNKAGAPDKPVTGEKELVDVRATLGGKKPLVSENTSSFADALGVVVPIPVWASTKEEINNTFNRKNIFFMIYTILC